MQWLSQVGNDYRPTSAYERGKRYLRRLKEFDGNVKALAEAEGIDRNIVNRCMNTAGLPKEILSIFKHPGNYQLAPGMHCQKFIRATTGPCSMLRDGCSV